MLTELFPDILLDRSPGNVIELNVCKNSEVPCVRYLISWTVKTIDYINRVAKMLPLSVYEGTWTHSPLSSLCFS